MQNEYVLEMKHITKRYGSNTVLSDVSLSVKKARSMRFWVKTARANPHS